MIERINYSTVVIMIDANNFKAINDNYGHACGDRTLKKLAKAICSAYGQYAYCFRLGGDEFCAILKPGVFEELVEKTENCDAYNMAEKFLGRLDETIAALKDKDKYLRYGVSQGYGIYYSQTSYPSIEEQIPLEKVIELADKRMYRSKELSKTEHSLDEEAPGFGQTGGIGR